MKIMKQLMKFYAVEQVMRGAARSLGVSVYRRDLGTCAFIEIELAMVFWLLLVSLPVPPGVQTTSI
jgi:hypothetical protein